MIRTLTSSTTKIPATFFSATRLPQCGLVHSFRRSEYRWMSATRSSCICLAGGGAPGGITFGLKISSGIAFTASSRSQRLRLPCWSDSHRARINRSR